MVLKLKQSTCQASLTVLKLWSKILLHYAIIEDLKQIDCIGKLNLLIKKLGLKGNT